MSARNDRTFLFALTIFVLCAATGLYPADKTSLAFTRFHHSHRQPDSKGRLRRRPPSSETPSRRTHTHPRRQ